MKVNNDGSVVTKRTSNGQSDDQKKKSSLAPDINDLIMHPIETLKITSTHYIGSLKHTLGYQVDNNYIHHGYRINYDSPSLIVKSLFHKHNELINIWTHLIGGLLALAMIVYVATSFTYVQEFKNKLSVDLEHVFDSVKQEYLGLQDKGVQIINKYSHSTMDQFFSELETFENLIITTDHYQELMTILDKAKNLFTMSDLTSDYHQNLSVRLDTIKRKLIQQIDSEQFDWMEIYRFNYKSINLDIKFQGRHLRKPSDPLRISRWPIFVFLVSAIICLFGSSVFHLFYQMSEKASRYLMRVDYAGISLLILGSVFPPFYYGFYCDFWIRYFYLLTVGCACLAVYIISIFDFIHSEPWRKAKGVMYASLGIFAGVPSIHLYYREYTREPVSDILPFNESFIYYLLMGASYLIGLVFYVLRIPERFRPGSFDILGHSHQIWHVFVFLGVLSSYCAALINLDDRRHTPCIIR